MVSKKFTDEYFMKQCLDLAENGLGKTYPNPIVGAIIVYKNKIIGFPKLKIEFIDSIENNLLKEPAIKIEETLKLKLKDSRKLDLMMGGSLYGSHKTEFFCYNKEKNMPADMCSSGEQKLLLISIILREKIGK